MSKKRMPDELYQSIYFSPHLDDAVLSCGGRIYQERQAGSPVLVVNVMAGDPAPEALDGPFVNALHARWKLEGGHKAVAARRAEDREALSILGVDGVYWDWPDCIYRRHPETGDVLYDSEASLFGPVHPAEAPLVEQLGQRMAGLSLAPNGRVYLPLAVGGHVDHRLVRGAVERWGAVGKRLVYYQDYPYAEEPEALVAALNERKGWRAEIVPLDKRAMTAKIAAVASYRSQLSTFFAGAPEMASRLRAYAVSVSAGKGWAERYWHCRVCDV